MNQQVKISDFYCSEFGQTITNQELYDDIKGHVIDTAPEETQSLYQKLLLEHPSRKRKVTHDMKYMSRVTCRTERLKLYEESVRSLMVDAVDGLFKKSGFIAQDIDFIVVTSSVGKTMPSAASILASEFKFKSTTVTLNLGDMACSSGLAALDTGARFLRSERKAKRCLVVSLEAVTTLFNVEDEGAVPNVVFGEGCAAVLLTTHREPALYSIEESVRTISSNESDLEVIRFVENESGPSIKLSRDVPKVAGKSIEKNLKQMVPRVLTLRQKLSYLLTKKVPFWQRNIDFWALHPGGTAVLNGLSKNLQLSRGDLGFSFRVFESRSNMSSPSIFYVLGEIEKQRLKKNQKVLMMSFGSGFKVNSMVLRRRCNSKPDSEARLDVDYLNGEIHLTSHKQEGDLAPERVLNREDLNSLKIKTLIKKAWPVHCGYNDIKISAEVVDALPAEQYSELVEGLYSLLLPNGHLRLPSRTDIHLQQLGQKLSKVRQSLKLRFLSLPKRLSIYS